MTRLAEFGRQAVSARDVPEGIAGCRAAAPLVLKHGQLSSGVVARALDRWKELTRRGGVYRSGSEPCGFAERCGSAGCSRRRSSVSRAGEGGPWRCCQWAARRDSAESLSDDVQDFIGKFRATLPDIFSGQRRCLSSRVVEAIAVHEKRGEDQVAVLIGRYSH
jgi:hypothetical protein